MSRSGVRRYVQCWCPGLGSGGMLVSRSGVRRYVGVPVWGQEVCSVLVSWSGSGGMFSVGVLVWGQEVCSVLVSWSGVRRYVQCWCPGLGSGGMLVSWSGVRRYVQCGCPGLGSGGMFSVGVLVWGQEVCSVWVSWSGVTQMKKNLPHQ